MPRACWRNRWLAAASGASGAAVVAVVAVLVVAPRPVSAAANPKKAEPGPAARSVDLRPVFVHWGLEPRRQGGRGTCSAFVVTGALEYALADLQRRGTRLSVEFLNWASNQAIGKADDGGFFSDLWKGFSAHGICPEADLPYQPRFDPELRPNEEAIAQARKIRSLRLHLRWIKPWDVTTGLSDEEFLGIKHTLARHWPVCAGLRWPKRERWEGEVLQWADADGVRDGHSVLLVGYRDDPAQPGGGVLVFRNTARDGRDGAMTYRYARAYINDAAWVGHGGREASAKPARPEAKKAPARPEAKKAPRPEAKAAVQQVLLDFVASPPHPRPLSREGRGELLPDGGRTDGGNAAGAPPGGAGLHDAAGPDWLSPLGPAPPGRNRRVSSNQQPEWNSENLDMTWLRPGESVRMPVLEGPGVITHIWMTSHAGWVGELGALTLRIYWDGREQPGVEVPLGDFFAVGQGKPAAVESVPVQVSPSGSLTCYWRMPFARSARIVVTNDNPERSTGLYWQVDWTQVDAVPAGTPYFHARYRREYPAVAKRDYLLADLEGRGRYLGTVLSVTLGQDGWFGEGDDFFYVDGEKVPSLQGTGSEDYFNDAWGFRPRTGLWFGQPRWQGDNAGDSGVCYRWHLPDPVHFDKSLQVAIEHKGNREESEDGFYFERPDFLSSVAFWYQTGEPKPFGELPPWHQRRVPWESHHLVKAFRQARTTGPDKLQVDTTGFFGARPVLVWKNRTPDAVLTIPFQVAEAGRYAVRLTAGTGADHGEYFVAIDGKTGRKVSFRTPEPSELDQALGTHVLAQGSHTISFRCTGVPSQGLGPLTVEMLRLLKLPPEAKREVRDHNEAHFIRLGIGRAVYAYRLAYDKVPESLDALVQSGIMPARYLKDENGLPLRCRREGDFIVVESPRDGGWTHRWQGLDARR